MKSHRGSRLLFALVLLLSVGCRSVYTPDDGKRWGEAERIEEQQLNWATRPQIAMDRNGDAVAVWDESNETPPENASDDIWSNRYTRTDGWPDGWDPEKTKRLENEEPEAEAVDAQLAIDPQGNVVAVWRRRPSIGQPWEIWSSRYTPDDGWDPEKAERIGDPNTSDDVQPQIAVDLDGNAMAVWAEYDGMVFNVRASRYEPAIGWGEVIGLETNDTGDASGPQVIMDPDGDAIAVWEQDFGTRFIIFSSRYTAADDRWGTPEPIDDDNGGDAEEAKIGGDAKGNAMAVWRQSNDRGADDPRFDIWSARYTSSDGQWGPAELVESHDTGSASAPQVAVAPNGDAVAVWVQFDGTNFDVWSNRYTFDVGWGTAEGIETDDRGPAESPQVAVDPNGNAVAVWTQSDGVQFRVWSNRYTPDTKWGRHQAIGRDTGGRSWWPRVAMDGDGNALAVWAQEDKPAERFDIWSNRLAEHGTSGGTGGTDGAGGIGSR